MSDMAAVCSSHYRLGVKANCINTLSTDHTGNSVGVQAIEEVDLLIAESLSQVIAVGVFEGIMDSDNVTRSNPNGHFAVTGDIAGYMEEQFVVIDYTMTSLYSEYGLTGSNKYQGVSSELEFTLVDHDGNIMRGCSVNTPTYTIDTAECSTDGSVAFEYSHECRFKGLQPVIPMKTLFAAAKLEMNEYNEKWETNCMNNYANKHIGKAYLNLPGDEGVERLNTWFFGEQLYPDFASLINFGENNNLDYICKFAGYPRFGTRLLLSLSYDNKVAVGSGDAVITAKVHAGPFFDPIPGSQSSDNGKVSTSNGRNISWTTHTARHGILVQVHHDGTICDFSVQALLAALAATLGLFTVATLLTEYVLRFMSPETYETKKLIVKLTSHRNCRFTKVEKDAEDAFNMVHQSVVDEFSSEESAKKQDPSMKIKTSDDILELADRAVGSAAKHSNSPANVPRTSQQDKVDIVALGVVGGGSVKSSESSSSSGSDGLEMQRQKQLDTFERRKSNL